MGRQTLFEKVRQFVGSACFKIFLWSVKMTSEEYTAEIYYSGQRNPDFKMKHNPYDKEATVQWHIWERARELK